MALLKIECFFITPSKKWSLLVIFTAIVSTLKVMHTSQHLIKNYRVNWLPYMYVPHYTRERCRGGESLDWDASSPLCARERFVLVERV